MRNDGHREKLSRHDKPEQSCEALATACRAFDGGACYYAGSILAEGRLGEKDEPRALEMFRTGCAQEHPLCCSWVGLMYQHGRGVEADPDLAFTLFKKGCALGEENVGCFKRPTSSPDCPRRSRIAPGSSRCSSGPVMPAMRSAVRTWRSSSSPDQRQNAALASHRKSAYDI